MAHKMTKSIKQKASYSPLAKWLHWGFAGIFAFGVYKQVDDVEQLADTAFLHIEFVFAGLFLALLIIRYFYLKRTQSTALPEESHRLIKLAANLVHIGLYSALAGIAISGIAIGMIYARSGGEGNLIDAVIGLHELSINASYILIAGHIVAALYHRFRKDGVWGAMVPFFKD